MFFTDYARDLAASAAAMGLATFVWAGWAQERPRHWVWRIVLAVLSLAGATIMGLMIPQVVKSWESPTALIVGSLPFVVYVAMVAFEVVAGVIVATILVRRKQTEKVAPLMLLIVGIHWLPMGWVFALPILAVVALLTIGVAIVAFRLPSDRQAPSFWCGILTAPITLIAGVVLAVAAFDVPPMPCSC